MMAVWRIHTWQEVEELAIQNNTCIRPREPYYEKARRDFERSKAVYMGYSTPKRRSYARLVLLEKGTFLDYIASANQDEEREDVYRCLQEMAEMMRQDDISHFYVPATDNKRQFFDDREIKAIPLHRYRRKMPSKTSWLSSSNFRELYFIDLLQYADDQNGHGQI